MRFALATLDVEGAEVERRLGRSLMPRLHSAFSLGTAAGAGVGAASAAAGVLGGNTAVALAGAALWGLGASLAFPVGMSAAAADPLKAAARLSVVCSIGYIAFLAGPPLIGLVRRARAFCVRCWSCSSRSRLACWPRVRRGRRGSSGTTARLQWALTLYSLTPLRLRPAPR